MTIADYFAKFGEDKFRIIEKECLLKTFSFNSAIIATGGGTPCFFDNIDQINTNGISFYIKASVKLLTSRIVESKNSRPLISNFQDSELAGNLNRLLTKREIFYEKAHHIVSAINTVDEVLEIINSAC
jgi:shikimate kinase